MFEPVDRRRPGGPRKRENNANNRTLEEGSVIELRTANENWLAPRLFLLSTSVITTTVVVQRARWVSLSGEHSYV